MGQQIKQNIRLIDEQYLLHSFFTLDPDLVLNLCFLPYEEPWSIIIVLLQQDSLQTLFLFACLTNKIFSESH